MDRKIKIKAGKDLTSQKLVDKAKPYSVAFNVRKGEILNSYMLRDYEKPLSIEVKRSELLGHRYLKIHEKNLLASSMFNNYFYEFGRNLPDSIKGIEFITSEKLQGALPTEKSEHEKTREHVSERFDKLSFELANKEDLIKAKDEIINKIKSESIQTQKLLKDEILEIKESLLRYLPHKITFRISIYFVSLFLFAFFADMLGVQIIKPFWNILGMSVSGGFLIMAYFLFLDWKKCNANGTDS